MKIFSVTVNKEDYLFTDSITAEHFVKKCKAANNVAVKERIVHQPSTIDALAEDIDENSLFDEPDYIVASDPVWDEICDTGIPALPIKWDEISPLMTPPNWNAIHDELGNPITIKWDDIQAVLGDFSKGEK